MSSEYDPLFSPAPAGEDDLATVRELFRAASAPYLRSPWSWLTWALVLPAAALATSWVISAGTGGVVKRGMGGGPALVLLVWSVAILLGGAVEIAAIRRARGTARATPLAAWALRLQGNLSLVALVLSFLLVWQDLAWVLPGLWLLLLGHAFYVLGGLSFEPYRAYGLIYQAGGIAALWPGGAPLGVFALAAGVGNLWMAVAVWREGRGREM
jgi:hypothetical protein